MPVLRGDRVSSDHAERGSKYVDRTDVLFEVDDRPEELVEEKPRKKARKKRVRHKHDCRHIKQARELRDRFFEEVNSDHL